MAHGNMTISLMDSDLVEGMVRAVLALHQADAKGDCQECMAEFPCPTVRIIAANQEAAVHRISSPFTDDRYRSPRGEVAGGRGRPYEFPEPVARGPLTHDFKYPECPEFSGGICDRHHGRALHPQMPSVA